MIYTVTFNPAIDYVVRMGSELLPGMTNRTDSEECYFGGKGINVSSVLKNLGHESCALGFVAGFTGDAIVRSVEEKGIKADFIKLPEGMSRINVKIKGTKETEINSQGPSIPPQSLEKLYNKIKELSDGDILILAGSIPSSLPDNVYENIMSLVDDKGVEVVVDATKDLLIKALKHKPFLIKPNIDELGEIFGEAPKNDEEIEKRAKELKDMGARNVLVSMGGDGALLVTEKGDTLKRTCPEGTVKNSVGAGDSMVAGFIAGFLNDGYFEEALKMGIAAGSATAFSDDLASRDMIEKVYGEL
ncbi:1-phosphofructokinase [Butyrivibrio sp. XB500-5]|uniref:1-phosphofructokinase n=1 Tax=Butyrivibrio sp. XB500-5 TaxID=2364880 RepID=UPI000EAA9697|nr:1-phosphofructokinase [Butyrivibrio sp. XB500-5]RKM63218.1 1-phosphofructokinase [Butyrivibrio sp. XB500-5]